MKMVTLGSTGITVPQNGFGALPVQRRNFEDAAAILRRAYEGGMTFFDTARAYSDSEEKIGLALSDVRKNIYIATKTGAKTPDEMKAHIETSLRNMKTDYIDIYQFHFADQCYAPGDGTGMYETMEEFKRQGLIKHIGITCHKIGVAEECVKSGLYETIQFPLSYLSSQREADLTRLCKEQNMGFIAMKGLAGGLINNARAAFAYMSQFDNVVPIWGIQKEAELEEWLSFFDKPAAMDDEIRAFIEAEKKELDGNFCRGCGYCMPCPQGIK
ncbi:MAG: aldo/keto reductase, partial [Firmicutes bacterium]|nr:aldo/keto reductase [Bacillota bacterium]